MHDQYAIRRHLEGTTVEADGVQFFTGFALALREARSMTGRDPQTGQKLNSSQHLSWLGNLGYMVLLDQLGTCFCRKGHREKSRFNGFKGALREFTDLEDSHIEVLYALRCCLAHDFSLIAIDRDGRPTHHFRLVGGHEWPLATLPNRPWEGCLALRSSDDATTVNLEKFGDQAEEIVKTIRELNDTGQIQIRLRDGWYALIQRYAVSLANYNLR